MNRWLCFLFFLLLQSINTASAQYAHGNLNFQQQHVAQLLSASKQRRYNESEPAAYGCAICHETGDCSHAVNNESEGVFCGQILSTFQPCCCHFRNECATTIFSQKCDCYTAPIAAEREAALEARFYLFLAVSFVAWALLLYEKMCGRPYKVMNSNPNRVLLANGFPPSRQSSTSSRDETLSSSQHTSHSESSFSIYRPLRSYGTRNDGEAGFSSFRRHSPHHIV